LTTVYVLKVHTLQSKNSVHPRDLMLFKDCIDYRGNQGYIVRFGQCSVFLIPINKRRCWKLVLSLTDGALYCS
jgi:hypothetical protein